MLGRSLHILFLSLLLAGHGLASLECRPEGPVVPAPRSLAKSSIFRDAASNLTEALDRATKGEIQAGWAVENTSFSLGLVSLDQESSALPVWEYHHLSPANVNGTKQVDRDSQYIIGSVSKVITDAIMLRSGVDLDKSITEFLPELGNTSSLISWENITLRALASQQAGIPPNCGHLQGIPTMPTAADEL